MAPSDRPTILITGRNGQVGRALMRALPAHADVIAVGRDECDLTYPAGITSYLEELRPDLIINPAAYTAVDKAETERDLAMKVNAGAPAALAAVAAELGVPIIHYSTDYVFDGNKDGFYRESDLPNPLSVYGASKLAGEEAVRLRQPKHVILRVSWVFSADGRNFLKTILRLARDRDKLSIVSDQQGAPSSADMIAAATVKVVDRLLSEADPEYGTYHLAAEGETSWHGYAQHIVAEAARIGVPLMVTPDLVLPISSADYPTAAARPRNSRLDTEKFRTEFDYTPANWREEVSRILGELKGEEQHNA